MSDERVTPLPAGPKNKRLTAISFWPSWKNLGVPLTRSWSLTPHDIATDYSQAIFLPGRRGDKLVITTGATGQRQEEVTETRLRLLPGKRAGKGGKTA